MVNARAKGQRGEREVVALLQPVVNKVYAANGLEPPNLERNLMQSRNGGYDIVGLEWLALEVKRQENTALSSLAQWWAQTKRQAIGTQTPVLFYRANSKNWGVMMYGYLFVGSGDLRVKAVVEVSADAFLVWFELRIEAEIKARGLKT